MGRTAALATPSPPGGDAAAGRRHDAPLAPRVHLAVVRLLQRRRERLRALAFRAFLPGDPQARLRRRFASRGISRVVAIENDQRRRKIAGFQRAADPLAAAPARERRKRPDPIAARPVALDAFCAADLRRYGGDPPRAAAGF